MAQTTSETRAHAQPVALGFILALALCALLTAALWQADNLPPVLGKAVALCFFVLALPFEIFVHELGHYAAAKALGWHVPLFALGPLTLRISPLRVHIGAPPFGPNTAGAVVAVPGAGAGSRLGWFLVYAGGPAANVFFAVLCLLAAAAAARHSTPRDMFEILAVLSLVSGLYNLVPFRSYGGGASDGRQMLAVLASRNVKSRTLRVRLYEQMLRGTRPRDWPDDLVGEVAADSIWLCDPSGQLLVYTWYMDRGEIARARSILERIRPQGWYDEQIHAEEAFLRATVDGDAAGARRELARTHSWAMHGEPSFWRAAAALGIAEGDGPAAREAIRKGRIVLGDSPYATDYDRDWFDTLERKLAGQMGA